jgi:hypothetical protein
MLYDRMYPEGSVIGWSEAPGRRRFRHVGPDAIDCFVEALDQSCTIYGSPRMPYLSWPELASSSKDQNGTKGTGMSAMERSMTDLTPMHLTPMTVHEIGHPMLVGHLDKPGDNVLLTCEDTGWKVSHVTERCWCGAPATFVQSGIEASPSGPRCDDHLSEWAARTVAV